MPFYIYIYIYIGRCWDEGGLAAACWRIGELDAAVRSNYQVAFIYAYYGGPYMHSILCMYYLLGGSIGVGPTIGCF
jgi:hypothetical protein